VQTHRRGPEASPIVPQRETRTLTRHQAKTPHPLKNLIRIQETEEEEITTKTAAAAVIHETAIAIAIVTVADEVVDQTAKKSSQRFLLTTF
jgi:hypothetical protein